MSIPEELEKVITASGLSETEFWALVSAHHYAELVAQNRDHILVFVNEKLDFSKLEEACRDYRHYAGGQGQEERHTISKLCRAVVVKVLAAWSYRQTEAEIRSNDLVRWFVGYNLREATLDHTTLWRFERWLREEQPRLYWEWVVGAIDQAFPEEVKQAQIGDTFALESRAREQSRTELMRYAAGKVLHYLRVSTAAGYLQVLMQVDREGLFGAEDEKPERYMEKPERDALELCTGRAVHGLLRVVDELLPTLPNPRDLPMLGLAKWHEVLHKALDDEFVLTTDGAGQLESIAHPDKRRKGRYRRGSAIDLDATFRIHGDTSHFGYNINIAATPRFIREINAMPGAAPDSTGVATLIANQREYLGVVPPKLIYDKAAGSPKIFAQVSQVSGGQTQLVAHLIGQNRSERFGPLDFVLEDDLSLTCPNGQVAEKRTYIKKNQGWQYRFLADQCDGCPLRERCRTPKAKPRSRRVVFISDYRVFHQEALDYTLTAAFQEDMALRPNIERIIAGVTRYNNGRYARGYGMANADYQVKMAAMAYNLKRWHKIDQEGRRAQRYQPPDPDRGED